MGNLSFKVVAFSVAVFAGLSSCAREPQYSPIPIGKPMVIMPMSSTPLPSKAQDNAKAVHMMISWTGLPLAKRPRDTLIKFYRDKDMAPYYEVKWSELKLAYKLSKCSNEQIMQLDGPNDAVLICDGRLGAISRLREVELSEVPVGLSVKTSSFNTYQKPDDVLGLMIQAY